MCFFRSQKLVLCLSVRISCTNENENEMCYHSVKSSSTALALLPPFPPHCLTTSANVVQLEQLGEFFTTKYFFIMRELTSFHLVAKPAVREMLTRCVLLRNSPSITILFQPFQSILKLLIKPLPGFFHFFFHFLRGRISQSVSASSSPCKK